MLIKPSALDRKVDKYERQLARKAARDQREREQAAEWRVTVLKVRARDKDICRVCHAQTVTFGKGDPRLWGCCHHIRYRSAGGDDSLANLVLVCQRCHDDEHRHLISITGTADNLKVERTTGANGQ